MKPLSTVWSLASWAALSLAAAAQANCAPIALASTVEVPAGEFSLANLLPPGTCPPMVQAASTLRLGGAPLAGSVRVLGRAEIGGLLARLDANWPDQAGAAVLVTVPERVIIRRAGPRASCAELGAHIAQILRPAASAPSDGGAAQLGSALVDAENLDCGAVERIPQSAPLAIRQAAWDRTGQSWNLTVRCLRASDCVPFLVRVRGPGLGPGVSPLPAPGGNRAAATGPVPGSSAARALPAGHEPPTVRRGESVMLAWDGAGIRLLVPAVCLDSAAAGERVRARLAGSGRIMPAIVVAQGMLRAAS